VTLLLVALDVIRFTGPDFQDLSVSHQIISFVTNYGMSSLEDLTKSDRREHGKGVKMDIL